MEWRWVVGVDLNLSLEIDGPGCQATRHGGLDSDVCVYTSAIDLLAAARGRACPVQERIEMRLEGQNSRTSGGERRERADVRLLSGGGHIIQLNIVLFLPAKQQQSIVETRQEDKARQGKTRETARLANRLFSSCCCCCCSGYSCGDST